VCEISQQRFALAVSTAREHKGRLIVSLQGCSNRNEAQRFVGGNLYAAADTIELKADEFLDQDLIGTAVFDEAGTRLGAVTQVEHFPSSDMLVLGKNRIPLVRSFIVSVDTQAKRITVRLPPGLLDKALAEEA